MKLVIVTPHFSPDVAPTGAVFTRITEELGARGHTIEVVTSLPWYREHRVERGYEGRLTRVEDTPWGRILRVHPFPAQDKRHIVRRAAAFAGFSALAAARAARGGPVDGVLAISPPLTLPLTGWTIARRRKGTFVFNVQDVYPDVAVDLGVIADRRMHAAASRVERFCYERADAVTVLSEDVKQNISARMSDPSKIEVIPNFVDTLWIAPSERENDYRREFGLQGKVVVMYAGNVGLSQSLDLMIDAAAALSHDERITFVINGQGAALSEIKRRAGGLPNVVFVDMQPADRLPEVLAAADVHVVPLKKGLARSSVPSKIYSILAAGRPLVASIDEGSEVARLVEQADCGIAIPPEDPEAFVKAVWALTDAPGEAEKMGAAGRAFVEDWASPEAVARAYEALFTRLR